MLRYIFCAFVWVASNHASAQQPYYLLFDDEQSEYFGAENLITAHRILHTATDSLIPSRLWDENTFIKKAGGIGYRMLKLGLFDIQFDFMLALVQHEAYGHGSRFREFGADRVSVTLSLFMPYGQAGGSAGGRYDRLRLTTVAENMAINFSGNEANLLLSDGLEQRMFLDDAMHYRQASLYFFSRNNMLNYTLRTHLFDAEGDMRSYINLLNPDGEPDRYTEKDLFLHNLIAIANPFQLYMAWMLGKKYILDGEGRWSGLPAVRFNDTRYLPALNFNLTPFGAEFILNNYFARDNKLLLVQARLGEGSFHTFYGGGLRVVNLIDQPGLRLNADLHGWRQPALSLGGEAERFIDAGWGMSVSSDVSVFPFPRAPRFGLYGHLGYKTPGYLMGQPLTNGLLWRIGVALDGL